MINHFVLTPLLTLVNSSSKDLTYGNLLISYLKKFLTGDTNEIPNLYEYESHYKSMARYIQRLTKAPSRRRVKRGFS
jgi:hypothetical protein